MRDGNNALDGRFVKSRNATLLHAAVFASGVSALIFQTLWFRQAGLAFGNSVWASSLVLSSFMGGLALGNGLAGRYGDRLRNPIRAYAIAEEHPGVDAGGVYRVLRNLEKSPSERLRAALFHGRLFGLHGG